MTSKNCCFHKKKIILGAFICGTFFSLAFSRSFLRIQTTLIGYELGDLKLLEGNLLEQRAQLQMELAKITTKEHLMLLCKKEKKDTNSDSFAIH
jgi:hypothetical protein